MLPVSSGPNQIITVVRVISVLNEELRYFRVKVFCEILTRIQIRFTQTCDICTDINFRRFNEILDENCVDETDGL